MLKNKHITQWFETAWYAPTRKWLYPLALFYRALCLLQKVSHFKRYSASLPVIVVGSLLVGGAGKTPVVLAVIEMLKARGYRVGVVSRGYGRTTRGLMVATDATLDAKTIGDEPYLIHRRTGVPVVVCKNRVKAVKYLEKHQLCDVIVSDDGLFHWALKPSFPIVIKPAYMPEGNGGLLPQGPLRGYLGDVPNAVVWQEGDGYQVLLADTLHRVSDPKDVVALETLRSRTVLAYAGIARPERLMRALEDRGLKPVLRAFPDHHGFSQDDFHDMNTVKGVPIIMTEKDAVKCQAFAPMYAWFVKVRVLLSEHATNQIIEHIKGFKTQ